MRNDGESTPEEPPRVLEYICEGVYEAIGAEKDGVRNKATLREWSAVLKRWVP